MKIEFYIDNDEETITFVLDGSEITPMLRQEIEKGHSTGQITKRVTILITNLLSDVADKIGEVANLDVSRLKPDLIIR